MSVIQVSDRLNEAAAQLARTLVRPTLAPIRLSVTAIWIECFGFSLGYWFTFYAATPVAAFHPVWAAGGAALLGVLTVAVLAAIGAYRLGNLVRMRRSALQVSGVVALALFVAALEAGPAVPGGIFWAGLGALLIVFIPLRLCLAAAADWAVASGLTSRRAVIAGGGVEAERLLRGLTARPGNDIRVCAVFDDRGSDRVGDLTLDVPRLGRFDELVEFCRVAEVDLIILTLPQHADQRIGQLLDLFRVLPVPVHLSAFSRDFAFPDDPDSGLLPASYRAERRMAKRAFDLIFGTLMLFVFTPVMIFVAGLIRLDSPGPIFFRQERHGFNDRPIRVWKFRTMYADQCDPRADRVVTKGDARVTRVGRFLRRSSLDELPQLFNVLGGTLSLVGPRPHALDARSSRQERFAQIVQGYSARHRLPPGITGWAQIHGWRGEVDDPESLRHRFDHDLFYIENWSLWLDLMILLRTPGSLLDTRKAY
ncbi:MAG: exopolysaccharide biosynthesis polyprenyl glycosylphosphotransferase [Rhodobacteraceae bacterium]|nr:exopolysaccharide biosynthesis polyprenyl glycosylphosphotransferase [Paracoccaceae bacterium]